MRFGCSKPRLSLRASARHERSDFGDAAQRFEAGVSVAGLEDEARFRFDAARAHAGRFVLRQGVQAQADAPLAKRAFADAARTRLTRFIIQPDVSGGDQQQAGDEQQGRMSLYPPPDAAERQSGAH